MDEKGGNDNIELVGKKSSKAVTTGTSKAKTEISSEQESQAIMLTPIVLPESNPKVWVVILIHIKKN